MPQRNEEDIRVEMLNQFLVCPHRDLDQSAPIHAKLCKDDPVFYAHLAAWYFQNGDIRDTKELFCAHLITDSYLENREVGLALWQQLPPYQKSKVLSYIKGTKVKIRDGRGKTAKVTEKNIGLKKNPPRSFTKEIQNYLKALEADSKWFDSVSIIARKDLKKMYASCRVKPSERAQAILFDENPPKDSIAAVIKKITETKHPATKAKLIVENKIPYRIATSLVGKITPSILVALINNMSSQELVNNLASLKKFGAYDNKDVKKLIQEKLKKAQTAKRVSVLKTEKAAKEAEVDEDIAKDLEKVTNKQATKKGTIKRATALLVDKSASMEIAIELGIQAASLIGGITTSNLYVVAFDTMAREIRTVNNENSVSAWKKAFAPIRAHGGTSCGVGIDFLRRQKKVVEQFVIITDQEENNSPRFTTAYKAYVGELEIAPPNVVIVSTGHDKTLERNCKASSIEYDVYDIDRGKSDYYSLPGLLPMLSRGTKLDLLYEIMDFQLPKRKSYVA